MFFGIGEAAVAAQHPAPSGGTSSFCTSMPFSAMMRPRSIGTRTSLPPGASCATSSAKPSTSPALDVDEEEVRRLLRQAAGDLAAQIAVDQRQRHQQRQPEAERQHHRRRQRAGPMDVADRQPERGRAHARALARQPLHRQRRRRAARGRQTTVAPTKIDGDAAVAGRPDGERAPARARCRAPSRHRPGAASRGPRNPFRGTARSPARRGRGRAAGCAKASVTSTPNSAASASAAGIDAGFGRHRDDRLQRRARRERHQRAEHQADDDAEAGDQHDLDQIDGEDEAAGGAEALEGGDDAALAVEIGAHGIGDADAADDQRGQADQRQELREALDIGRQRGRGVAARAHVPAGLGKSALARSRDALTLGLAGAGRAGGPCRHARPGCPAGSGRTRAGPPSTPSAAARSRTRRRRHPAR